MAFLGTRPANQIIDSALIANNTITPDKLTAAAKFATGTALMFRQTAAPTGWTKVTTHDNAALRVVSGAVSSGGSVNFTTAFASQAVSGTVGGTTLTSAQIPAHGHTFSGSTGTVSSDHVHFDSGHRHQYSTVAGSGPIAAGGGFTLQVFDTQLGYAALGGISANHVHGFSGTTANAGSGESHNHTFTGTAINLDVRYVDVIIATKD